jgi:hypothetical protein
MILLIGPTAAWACPLCDSATADQVRAGLFDGHFLKNLAVVLLPFPLFIGLGVCVYFSGPRQHGAAPSLDEEPRRD